MLLGIYSQIKDRVTTREVAEFYGIRVNRTGMVCCPFHNDRTPSMKIDKGFICFGCQEKGDVIRFVSKLYSLTPYEAAMKIIEDMKLEIDIDKKSQKGKPGIRQTVNRERTEHKLFDLALKRLYTVFSDYKQLLDKWITEYAPLTPEDELHPFFVESCHNRDQIEYLIDILTDGTNNEKANILIDNRKEIDGLEKRIKQIGSGNGERPARDISSDTAGDDDGRSQESSDNH